MKDINITGKNIIEYYLKTILSDPQVNHPIKEVFKEIAEKSVLNNIPRNIEKAYPEAYRLARRFHELYEQTAPVFGYKTKKETKEFDPESANGRLMAFVCFEVVKEELQREIGNMFLCNSCRQKNSDITDKLELE